MRGDGTTGVYGVSTSGVGVMGESATGFAMYANGTVGQARDKGGFVKAMLYVGPDGSVVRCYNSQRSDGGAGSPPLGNIGCGFSVTNPGSQLYTIDFGFQVNDRFAVVSAGASGTAVATAHVFYGPGQNQIRVETRALSNADPVQADFTIIVY